MDLPLPERPRVRVVEVIPFHERGAKTFLLHDPAGYIVSPLQVSPAALVLLSLCDGTRTHDAIRSDYAARTGFAVGAEEFATFLASMDRALLFDSGAFAAHRGRLEADFAARSWRPAAHAGHAYDGDPRSLARGLDAWLDGGAAGGRGGERLTALVAPHIDFHRGGAGYGKVYAALRGREAPDVVVILGTGHAAEEGRFILCDKGFETPCGNLASDHEFLGRLERRLPRTYRRGQLAHRSEHSIEFQALWLAHLFRSEPRPAIVPILATTFDDLIERGATPQELPETADFLGALRETWLEEKRKLLVIAGADLSHVGPRFGDRDRLTPAFLDEVRGGDLACIDRARNGGADGFFAAVAEQKNRHRICSVAGIYAALYTVGARSADLLVYDQAVDPGGNLAVTFAGLATYGSDASGPARGLGQQESHG